MADLLESFANFVERRLILGDGEFYVADGVDFMDGFSHRSKPLWRLHEPANVVASKSQTAARVATVSRRSLLTFRRWYSSSNLRYSAETAADSPTFVAGSAGDSTMGAVSCADAG